MCTWLATYVGLGWVGLGSVNPSSSLVVAVIYIYIFFFT